MGHRAYVPHIVRKGALHLGCALDFAYPHWGPDAFSYDLTTVGSQESGRLFALPSVLFSYESRRKRLTAVLFSKKFSRLLLGKSEGQFLNCWAVRRLDSCSCRGTVGSCGVLCYHTALYLPVMFYKLGGGYESLLASDFGKFNGVFCDCYAGI